MLIYIINKEESLEKNLSQAMMTYWTNFAFKVMPNNIQMLAIRGQELPRKLISLLAELNLYVLAREL